MTIDFEIKSRGSMLIKYDNRTALISGELTFEPPIFYADLNSLNNWDFPFNEEKISENQKNEIISYITNFDGPTKIIFD